MLSDGHHETISVKSALLIMICVIQFCHFKNFNHENKKQSSNTCRHFLVADIFYKRAKQPSACFKGSSEVQQQGLAHERAIAHYNIRWLSGRNDIERCAVGE